MEQLLTFYALDYEGTLPESQRRPYLKKAAALLDRMTNRCPALRVEQEEALRYAICAAAEALYEGDQRAVVKEENGDLKITYSPNLSAYEIQAAAKAAYPYLRGTGLLYCGVRPW